VRNLLTLLLYGQVLTCIVKNKNDSKTAAKSCAMLPLSTQSTAPTSKSLRNMSNTSPARAGNRRFWLLSALRAHTKMPYKIDLLWETLRALKHPGRARTVQKPWYVRIHDE
jgi:hypothetical protein